MRPVSGKQPMPALLIGIDARLQKIGGKETLDEVVNAAVPVPTRKPQHACHGERLEPRADLVGGSPSPVDLRPFRDVSGRDRSLATNSLEQLLAQLATLPEVGALITLAPPLP